MHPLVSILIPAYNAEKFIIQCLDSIINQSYKHLQIIVIDDGSSDNTFSILKEYNAKYSNIEIYSQKNSGVAFTRNKLLSFVKGDFVLFVDSDDWIETDTIDYLLKLILIHNAEIVAFAKCDNIQNDNSEIIEIWNKEKSIFEFLRHTSFNGALWNKFMRASIVKDIAFDNKISYGEDALYIWNILQSINQMVIVNKQLYHYRSNIYSLSKQKWTPDKKGSGHLVWQTIVNDTKTLWPQYLYIANARFALEDMWGIYFAALSNYKYDEHIKVRQINIRTNLNNIWKAKIDTFDKYLVAFIFCRCYSFEKILKKLKK